MSMFTTEIELIRAVSANNEAEGLLEATILLELAIILFPTKVYVLRMIKLLR